MEDTILQPSIIAKTIIISLIILFIALALYILGTTELNLQNILSISLILIPIKYLQGLLMYQIKLTKTDIILRKTSGKITLNNKNVEEWGFRDIKTNEIATPVNMRFIEFVLTDDKRIIYPSRIFRYNQVKKEHINLIQSVLGSDPKEYKPVSPMIWNSPIKSLKYELIYLLL